MYFLTNMISCSPDQAHDEDGFRPSSGITGVHCRFWCQQRWVPNPGRASACEATTPRAELCPQALELKIFF